MSNHPNRSKHWNMTPDELSAAIDELVQGNQSELARMIGVDGRTVRRWLAGELSIPKPAQALLRVILALNPEQRVSAFTALRR